MYMSNNVVTRRGLPKSFGAALPRLESGALRSHAENPYLSSLSDTCSARQYGNGIEVRAGSKARKRIALDMARWSKKGLLRSIML